MNEPFFLLGAERAGLLLVELMVRAHPELAWGGDFDYAVEWAEPEHAQWPPLIPYWQHLAFSRRARELGLVVDPSLGFPDLVRSLLDQQRGAALRPFGVAVHGHYGRLVRLWPGARFVYVSRAALRGGVENTAGAAERLRASELAWRGVAAQIPASRRFELRYEALVAHLPSELARLCGFLGVSFEPELMRVPLAASAAAAPAPPPSLARRLASRLERRFPSLLGG